jgi:putative SOS response-associated peptidase YedK
VVYYIHSQVDNPSLSWRKSTVLDLATLLPWQRRFFVFQEIDNMCGRFVAPDTTQAALRFDAEQILTESGPRYNAAPTQSIAVVRARPGQDGGMVRSMEALRWGFVPSWARQQASATRKPVPLINAMGETLTEKPTFRPLVEKKRCIIPALGFYEWQVLPDGKKQPVYFSRADGEMFGIAGLWTEAHDDDGTPTSNALIITTQPNDLVADVHNRMPALLRPEDEAEWLDPSLHGKDVLPLLCPYPEEWMKSFPVSARVNQARFDDPTLIEPLVD